MTEATKAQHEEILAGLAGERAHSRIAEASGRKVEWTYNADGSMAKPRTHTEAINEATGYSPYVIVANQPACSTALLVMRGKAEILTQGSREWANGYSHGYAVAHELTHKGAALLPAGDARELWLASGDTRLR